MNLALQKKIGLPLRDQMAVHLRAEAFNLFNRTNFGAPNGDRGSGSFGTIRSAYAARQLQFAVRVTF